MIRKVNFTLDYAVSLLFLAIIIICLVDHVYYMTCPDVNGEGDAWVKCDPCDGEKKLSAAIIVMELKW